MNAVVLNNRHMHGGEIAPHPSWEAAFPMRWPHSRRVALSDAQRALSEQEELAYRNYDRVTSYGVPIELEFAALASRWKGDCQFESSPWRMAGHPAYQRIIGMGRPVVPLILDALSKEPDFWFEALVAITGAQPVPRHHAGDIAAMTQDWLQWGREHGYDC